MFSEEDFIDMDLFFDGLKQYVKIILLTLLLFFSFMSISMTLGVVETYCHSNHENLFKYAFSQRKVPSRMQKIVRKIRIFVRKFLSGFSRFARFRIVSVGFRALYISRVCRPLATHLFRFLCLRFNSGKYKNSVNAPMICL